MSRTCERVDQANAGFTYDYQIVNVEDLNGKGAPLH